tara:strand:+ start:126 stop:635 length:510 start_codon:yes stop_codon:yes gene_type:complete
LFSVGVSPGITNLLAAHCVSRLPQVEHIDLFLTLGMGERHGKASNLWFLDNLHKDYSPIKGENITITPFAEVKELHFQGEFLRAYNFNFSDQTTLMTTLPISTCRSWISLEPFIISRVIHLLTRLRITKVLTISWIKSGVLKLFGRSQMGPDRFQVVVVAYEPGSRAPN